MVFLRSLVQLSQGISDFSLIRWSFDAAPQQDESSDGTFASTVSRNLVSYKWFETKDIYGKIHHAINGKTHYKSPLPIGSMVLVYLPRKLGDFVRANVGKYSIHGAYGLLLKSAIML